MCCYIEILNNGDYRYLQVQGEYHHFRKETRHKTIFSTLEEAEDQKNWLIRHNIDSQSIKIVEV